jgi:hypothetical protein
VGHEGAEWLKKKMKKIDKHGACWTIISAIVTVNDFHDDFTALSTDYWECHRRVYDTIKTDPKTFFWVC